MLPIEARAGMIPAITGVGSAVGSEIKTNDDLIPHITAANPEKWGGKERAFRMLMYKVGIQTRPQVRIGEQATSHLATEASRIAMEMAGIRPEDIGSVVIATSSQDYLGLPVSPMVQDNLGIPNDVGAYDLMAACPGFGHNLRNAFYEVTHPLWDGKPMLIGGAETISPYTDATDENTYLLFGDAAGSVIVDLVKPDEGAPTIWKIVRWSDGSKRMAIRVDAGGTMNPPTERTVREKQHVLRLDGKVVTQTAIEQMTRQIKDVLEQTGYPAEEVKLIPHQANKSIMNPVAENVGVPREHVVVTIDRYGNTSSASIPTALYEGFLSGQVKRNEVVVFCTAGAGINVVSGVIPMVGLPQEPDPRFHTVARVAA
ncbi:MAG: ketoacyl-ACP synthase III [Candidatus Levybacteria bacterium]|nr:ketoacyl-ACP synthase III [Candidatus Levybacteria bacterium]